MSRPSPSAAVRETSPRVPKPPWLKVRAPGGDRYNWIKARARERGLATVCEEARCPNVGECWGAGTATFMVLGDLCTRGCRFCAVATRRSGRPLDAAEPENLGRTIAEMGLDYAVVTSVDRDDLPDQGAGHFAACIAAVRALSPRTRIEVLIPDFRGLRDLLLVIVRAGADVVGHNVEVPERLTSVARDPRAGYRQSLDVLRILKELDPRGLTKSSLMVGLGEAESEVVSAMRDLRAVGCDLLTVGQYLRPTVSARHLPVEAYVPPEAFERYRVAGLELGFRYVASGPLVRSSYRAGEAFLQSMLTSADAR